MSKENIEEYLDMQRSQYNWRASQATVTKDIQNDFVVGSYTEQEKFPYDENILKFFKGDTKKSKILEYGCGPGRNLLRLASKFEKVVGVDISENNINNARKFLKLNNIGNFFNLYTNHGDDIPIESEKFNVVFAVICLQHICSYDIRKKILSEMVRVTQKDGIVVTQFGFNDTILSRYVEYYDNKLIGVKDTNGWCDCCVTDKNQLIKDFEDLGLKNIKTWFTDKVGDESHHRWIWCCGNKENK